jgi:hypothetical protein
MVDVDAAVVDVIHGVALEAADGDGLVFGIEDARTFAQFLDRADAGAGGTEKIGIENGARGTEEIAGGNFLDEARYVDVRGTGVRAWRVETHEAAGRLGEGFLLREGREEFTKPAGSGGRGKHVGQRDLQGNLIHTTEEL